MQNEKYNLECKKMKYFKILIYLLDKGLKGKPKGKIIRSYCFYILSHNKIRAYARNRVYNYVLQNDIYLPRLIERKNGL